MNRVVVTTRARRDLASILEASRRRFGVAAQHRYRLLIEQAFADLAEDAERPGVRADDALAPHMRLYHTRHSRARAPQGERVGAPRHLLVFRVMGSTVEIMRLLHDAMDVPEHLTGL